MTSSPSYASTYTGSASAHAEVARWVERLARLGYVAKGVVYAIVGVLAAQLAFGNGGQATGSRGALQRIESQPWGDWLLALVGFGLVGYAAWKLIQGIRDPEHRGTDAKGWAHRLGFIGSGVLHGSLAVSAFAMAFGGGASGGSGSGGAQGWTAKAMSHPWGLWLVGLAGLVTIVVGLRQFKKAYDESFRRKWDTGAMSQRQLRGATLAGRWGLSARGVVFVMIGFFFIQAAWQHDSSEAVGLGGALGKLASTTFGPWLLAVVALGLVAYAVFCFTQARYRHFQVH